MTELCPTCGRTIPRRRVDNRKRDARVLALADTGKTYGTISEMTGLSRGTISGIVFRARARVRDAKQGRTDPLLAALERAR